jgi:hypothetical protein
MNNIVCFPPSLLGWFLGTWTRDPLSVSRNKVVKRILGEDGLRLLWGCGSMADVRRCLADDLGLAAKYDALCRPGCEGRLVIARRLMTWIENETKFEPARTLRSPIVRVTAEGHKIIVHSKASPTVNGYVLRRKNEWLLVSERYFGPNAASFPSSPVFRYYRAD